MPKLRCVCGHVIDLSSIPDDGWITVRDADYERLLAAEQTEISERITTPLQGRLYECMQCRRLHWQREGSREFRVYSSEPTAT